MTVFEKLSAVDAVEVSLGAVTHLTVAHSALVAALRQLAVRVDDLHATQWEDDKGRLDNVTLPTFLKYCDALGLTVSADSKPGRVSKVVPVEDELDSFRNKKKGA